MYIKMYYINKNKFIMLSLVCQYFYFQQFFKVQTEWMGGWMTDADDEAPFQNGFVGSTKTTPSIQSRRLLLFAFRLILQMNS